MGSVSHHRQSIDLSHHINRKSKSRHPSPLKEIVRFMGVEGMVSLAGGLPHQSLFPIEQATIQTLPPVPSLSAAGEIQRSADDVVSMTLGRGSTPGDLDLSSFLQYGNGAGNKHLLEIVRTITDRVHAPPCQDYEVLLNAGNTNAWAKVVDLLCEDGDMVLVEEYTYPSAQAYSTPLGVKAVAVPSDANGIRADKLREVLTQWDETERGSRRPRILYMVTVGSNPTGVTISAQRSKEIYDVCVEFDIIIVEDDPYYFLQYSSFKPETSHIIEPKLATDDFLQSLAPSILSIDTQGRVIRLESFSKTIFPGLRLGYFVANPVFIERLHRAAEVDTQDPAGLSQAFALALLQKWGIDGYLDWMQTLRTQYRVRRDWLLAAFCQSFDAVLPAAESPLPDAQGSVVCLRKADGQLVPVFSFVDPTAGMFVWTKFYFGGVPRFAELAKDEKASADPERAFENELWMAWVQELVLLTAGSYYHPWQGKDKVTTKERGAQPETANFRFSFATPSKEQIELGVERMKKVVCKYWL